MNTSSARRTSSVVSALLVAGLASLISSPMPASEQEGAQESRASVRAQIEAMYGEWGRARVALDMETIEKILAPDFYVLLDGNRMTRAQFIERVTRASRTGGLSRFDADVMTMQGDEKGWTVVITEKLEYETIGADGKPKKAYSFWVTRDGCRKVGDRWQVTYSEAIGHETWDSGSQPPFADW